MAGWSLTLVGGGRWDGGLKNKSEVGRCTLKIGGRLTPTTELAFTLRFLW